MPTFPQLGKPDVSLLEQFFEPTDVVEQRKKAERLARSQTARNQRAANKMIIERRDMRGTKGS